MGERPGPPPLQKIGGTYSFPILENDPLWRESYFFAPPMEGTNFYIYHPFGGHFLVRNPPFGWVRENLLPFGGGKTQPLGPFRRRRQAILKKAPQNTPFYSNRRDITPF